MATAPDTDTDLPTWLVLEVVALLRGHGLDAAIPQREVRVHNAVTAAADMLTALRVTTTRSDNGVA